MPWYYYLDKMISFEGFVTPLIWLVGIVIALRRWTRRGPPAAVLGVRRGAVLPGLSAEGLQLPAAPDPGGVDPGRPRRARRDDRARSALEGRAAARSRRQEAARGWAGIDSCRTCGLIVCAGAQPTRRRHRARLLFRPAGGRLLVEGEHLSERRRDDAVQGVRAIRAVVLRTQGRLSVRALSALDDRAGRDGPQPAPGRRRPIRGLGDVLAATADQER